jgi:hypothetical protein
MNNTEICAAFESWFSTRRVETAVSQASALATIGSDRGHQRAGARPPKKLDRRIVPDKRWSGMYRIRRPDGSVSDMANLARIKDALRVQDEGSS